MPLPKLNITVLQNQIVPAAAIGFTNVAYVGLGRFTDDYIIGTGVAVAAVTTRRNAAFRETLQIRSSADLNATLLRGSPAYKDISTLLRIGGDRTINCLILNDQANDNTNYIDYTWADLVDTVDNPNSIRAFLQGLSEDVDLLGINFYEKGASLGISSLSQPVSTTAGTATVGMNGNLMLPQLRALNAIATDYRAAQKPFHLLLGGYLVSTSNYVTNRNLNAFLISGSTGGFRGFDLPHVSIFAISQDESDVVKHVSLGLILAGLVTRDISQSLASSTAGEALDGGNYYATFGNAGVDIRDITNANLELYSNDGIILLNYRGGVIPPQFTSDVTLSNTVSLDFNRIAYNRVFNAVLRVSAAFFNQVLDFKLLLNANGTLNQVQSEDIKQRYLYRLEPFVEGNHVSTLNVAIPPNQRPLENNEQLDVTLSIQPVGYARIIDLTLGFVGRTST